MRRDSALIILGALGFFVLSQTGASFMDTTLPEDGAFNRWDGLFQSAGRRYSVPWRWLKAIAWNESDLGRDRRVIAGAVSSDGLSYGLMQFTIKTARDYIGFALSEEQVIKKLNDPAVSVELAAQYIKRLTRLFNGDRKKIIMSYNQGEGNTQKGATYAAGYYDKFVRHLDAILEKQPGNERE